VSFNIFLEVSKKNFFYDYAVVCIPNRKYLDIKKNYTNEDKLFSQLIDFEKLKGLDAGTLIKTSHS
jgi:hypothetical protein